MTIPLVDVHCHLLPGLDDGPRTLEDALQMCRIAWHEGTRMIAAVAHISEQWPQVTPDRIRAATAGLARQLRRINLPLAVFPAAEVMQRIDLEDVWRRGELLSVADRGSYMLLELPAGVYLDLRATVGRLRALGIRPILAHPERHAELLHGAGTLQRLVRAGCLVQVSADSITHPACRTDRRALKRWLRQGLVHLLGSDGHSPRSRAPRIAHAYRRVARWAGTSTAARICSANGLAVLAGLPLPAACRRPTRAG